MPVTGGFSDAKSSDADIEAVVNDAAVRSVPRSASYARLLTIGRIAVQKQSGLNARHDR